MKSLFSLMCLERMPHRHFHVWPLWALLLSPLSSVSSMRQGLTCSVLYSLLLEQDEDYGVVGSGSIQSLKSLNFLFHSVLSDPVWPLLF